MDSKFITQVSGENIKALGRELIDGKYADKEFVDPNQDEQKIIERRAYAKKAMEAMVDFQPSDNDCRLFEATLAQIATKMIEPLERDAIASLFRIMDESGDGKLAVDEIIDGCSKILEDRILTKEEAEEIIKRVDLDFSGELDWSDFAMCTIAFKSESHFMDYMKNAYITFFNNLDESIETQEIID